tara:strand:- start:11548 stop:12282 length:735 start_codon:yes stop_codon:yes gene_type:complete
MKENNYKREFDFTYTNLEKILTNAISYGYRFIRHDEYAENKNYSDKIILLRIDVDSKINNLRSILPILKKNKIKATIFFRVHSEFYNLFGFESIRIVNQCISDGHEIGYHSEIVDVEMINNIDALSVLKKDISIMETFFGIKIKGIASHGGLTGYNNLDFWKNNNPRNLGYSYEAYHDDFQLFNKCLYISDSENYRWKKYLNGKVIKSKDVIEPSKELRKDNKLVNLLIHPDIYYNNHVYEDYL